MARYTDIDLLIEAVEETDWYHISKQGELVRGANSKDDIPLYKHSDIKEVLNNAPIADVVPKSEVERLENTYSRAVRKADKKAIVAIQNAKQEVAREIFAEIEEYAELQIESLNIAAKVDLSGADFFGGGKQAFVLLLDRLAELKKKYTEGEE